MPCRGSRKLALVEAGPGAPEGQQALQRRARDVRAPARADQPRADDSRGVPGLQDPDLPKPAGEEPRELRLDLILGVADRPPVVGGRAVVRVPDALQVRDRGGAREAELDALRATAGGGEEVGRRDLLAVANHLARGALGREVGASALGVLAAVDLA